MIITAVILFAFAGAGYDEILTDKKKQIDNVQKQIEEYKKIINNDSVKVSKIQREEDSLKIEHDALSKFLKDFSVGEFLSASEITREAENIRNLESEVEKIQNSFENKIINLYKRGKNYELELLLSAKTPNEYLRRNQYLQKFSQSRKKELTGLKSKKLILEEKKKLLRISVSSQRYYVESKQLRKKEIENKINQLNDNKRLLEKEIKLNETKISLKEAELKNIKSFISNFAEHKKTYSGRKTTRINYPTNDFEKLKSILNIPLDIAVVTNEFGENVNNATATVTINNGIDFSIARVSKVYAIGNGIVSLAGEIPYYGKVIIINHGNGYRTVYAILGESLVKPGNEVMTNQVIGRSGENVNGQGLHFEIWKDRTPLNPREWVRLN
ncbi:MAG: murein hydrolase activator EnvC family protein [Ignavibacteria bacterium]